jgi:hypothetical protein
LKKEDSKNNNSKSWAEEIVKQKFGAQDVFTNDRGWIYLKFADDARSKRILDELHYNNMMAQHYRNKLDFVYRQGASLWRKINQIIREKLGNDEAIRLSLKFRIDVDFLSATIILRPKRGKKE